MKEKLSAKKYLTMEQKNEIAEYAANLIEELNSTDLSDEEKKGIDTAEFFSRFRKQDKIYPVISIVVYYGEDAWDGAVESVYAQIKHPIVK